MYSKLRWLLPALLPLVLPAQSPPASTCENASAWSPCEIAFPLSDAAAAANPNPYATVDMSVEFRSPGHRTFAIPAFWDGGRRMVARFAPTEGGHWDYLVTGNLADWNNKTGSFTAAASDAHGFIRAANMHHWVWTVPNPDGIYAAHLWMGADEPRFAFLGDTDFHAMADALAAQKFNHVRGLVMGAGADAAYHGPDSPDLAFFQRLDARVRYLNQKGIIAGLVLAPGPAELVKNFPTPEQRRRFVRYIVARYAAMNVTWHAAAEFEDSRDARPLLKEIGDTLKTADPYQHPRTSGAHVTSAPLLDDKWMTFVSYGPGANDSVGSVERQLYPVPFVNQAVGSASGGPDALRHQLWNATMDGQYVASTADPSSPAAKAMTAWFDFMSGTRYWELEPYFDVDNGRALALEGIEYVVYVEKPGPVELLVQKHGYDVFWLNPVTGETVKQKKGFNGDHFNGEPPDSSHDWVLHVVRESKLESMGRSYKFTSREEPLQLQIVETDPKKTPFDIEQPAGSLSVSKPAPFAAKITRASRATRLMTWLWTGDVPGSGQGYRVLGTGLTGSLQPPAVLSDKYPTTMLLRLYGMNANGKVYLLDRGYQLTK